MPTTVPSPVVPSPVAKKKRSYITIPLAALLFGFLAILGSWISGWATLAIFTFFLTIVLLAVTARFIEKRWGATPKKWFVRAVGATATVVVIGGIIAVASGQFPLTAKLSPLFKKGIDIRLASKAPIAPTAKEVMLRDQVGREETAAYMIQELLKRGERGEAEKLMNALIDNGAHIRAITGNWGSQKKAEVKPQATQPPPAEASLNKIEVVELNRGESKTYKLNAGQTTPWIKTPVGVVRNIQTKDKTAGEKYFWLDGDYRIAKPGEDILLPDKHGIAFKVGAMSDGQEVMVSAL